MVEGAVHVPVGRGVSVDRQALIEEARRKARRRRIRNGAALLLAVGVGVAGFLGLGGQGGGGGAGSAAQASGGQGTAASAPLAPLVPRLPMGTVVWDVAFGARAPDTVYVATISPKTNTPSAVEGRVYKSTDSGGHWRLMLRSRWLMSTLAADPQRPGILYAGTEGAILKTLDSGRHWQALRRWPLPPGPYTLTVDPADSRVVYESSGYGISRSNDGGHHWKPLERNVGRAGSQWAVAATIAFAPSNPKIRYALWEYADPLLTTSTDGGKTSDGPGPLHISPGANQSQRGPVLAVDPHSPTTLYAALGHAVIKSTDAGKHWRSITRGLPGNVAVDSFAVDPRHPGIVYAAARDDVFKTTNAGRTWSHESTPIHVWMLAINPANPATIYAAGAGGIARSTNNGLTWIAAP